MSNAKRMDYSLLELNQIHLLDFIKLTNIYFGVNSNEKIKKENIKEADQADINQLLS